MNNNVIIGLILLVVLIGGGYYFSKMRPADQTVPVTTTTSTTSSSSKTSTTPTPAPNRDAPTVETQPTSVVSSSTVVVNGQVRPNGSSTSYWFEYGETTSLGSRTVSQDIGSGYTLTPTPAYITGLKANTVYYYRLSAKNSLGTVNGATYNFQTNNTPPVKVSAPSARTQSPTDVTRTTATINGQVNPNGWPTTYWFEYGTDTNLGNVTSFQATNSGTTYMNVSAGISGLQPSTKYYFRLNAQSAYGTANGTVLSFTTSGPAAPTAPVINTNGASNVTKTSATVSGQVNPNGDLTTYWFEYSQDSALANPIGNGTAIQTVPSTTSGSVTVKATVVDLTSNTTYYYRLMGRNAYGTVQGDIESFKTRP